MVLDAGLVEFGWERVGGDWTVTYFGAQPHRLPRLTEKGLVAPVLVERYGDFPARLDIHELRAAVAAHGGMLEERPTDNHGHVDVWSPLSRISVLVAMDPAATGEPPGTVVKMLGPTGRARSSLPSGALSVDRT